MVARHLADNMEPTLHKTLWQNLLQTSKTGSVTDQARYGRRLTASDESTTAMVHTAGARKSPTKSIRRLSAETGSSKLCISLIWKRKNGIYTNCIRYSL